MSIPTVHDIHPITGLDGSKARIKWLNFGEGNIMGYPVELMDEQADQKWLQTFINAVNTGKW